MKLSLFFILAIFILSYSSFGQEVEKTTSHISKEIELRISPEAASIDVPASELLNAVTYIPLESTSKSTFGAVSQLEVTDSYFVIVDNSTKAVLIFKRNGKFHAQINNYNNKPFFSISNIIVDKVHEVICIQAALTGRTNYYYYDFNGNSLSAKFSNGNFKDYYVLSNGRRLTAYDYSNSYNLRISDSSGREIKKAFQIDTSSIKPNSLYARDKYFFSTVDSSVYFLRNYDNNVYEIGLDDVLKTKYKIIFPAKFTLASNFIYGVEDKVKAQQGKIFQISQFYKIKESLFFQLTFSDYNLLSYNLKTGALISVSEIHSDSLSYDLPVANKYSTAWNSDGFTLFTSLSSLEMFRAGTKHKDFQSWISRLPATLKEYFKKGNEYANPVIVQIGFK